MDTRATLQDNRLPDPTVPTVIFVGRGPLSRPWWSRLSRQRWVHVAIAVGGLVWNQPGKGPGSAYLQEKWIPENLPNGVQWQMLHLTGLDPAPSHRWTEAAKRCAGRNAQPVRTALRYLRLWPRPAWNCVSPIREFVAAYGEDLEAETPDQLYLELMQ